MKHSLLMLSLALCLMATTSSADAPPDSGGAARAAAVQKLASPKSVAKPSNAPVALPSETLTVQPAPGIQATSEGLLLAPNTPIGISDIPSTPPLPDIETQPEAVIRLLLERIVSGEWWALAGGLLWVLMWALGKYGAAKWPVLSHPAAVVGITFLFSVAGGVFHSLVAGAAPSLAMLLAAVKAALVALIGQYGTALMQKQREAKAEQAAAAAAGGVVTREQAVSTFTGKAE